MKRAFVLLSMITVAAGCNSQPEGTIVAGTVPVSGTAMYQGKPLEDYTVYFSNLSDRPAAGRVDAQGRFTLSTNAEGDGAPPGTHRVWFTYSPVVDTPPGQERPDAPVPQPKVKLPAKYTSMESTDIKVEVSESGLTDYKLELK